jgi:hypothetical protein
MAEIFAGNMSMKPCFRTEYPVYDFSLEKIGKTEICPRMKRSVVFRPKFVAGKNGKIVKCGGGARVATEFSKTDDRRFTDEDFKIKKVGRNSGRYGRGGGSLQKFDQSWDYEKGAEYRTKVTDAFK